MIVSLILFFIRFLCSQNESIQNDYIHIERCHFDYIESIHFDYIPVKMTTYVRHFDYIPQSF